MPNRGAIQGRQALVIRTSVVQWGAVFVICLILDFVLINQIARYLVYGIEPSNRRGINALYIYAPICTATAIYALWKISRYRPMLIVAASGVLWRQWSDATIPWSAFSDAEVLSTGRHRDLRLRLREPLQFPPKRRRGFQGEPALLIRANGLEGNIDQIIDAVFDFAPDLFQTENRRSSEN